MSEENGRVLNHFASYAFRRSFWEAPPAQRRAKLEAFVDGLKPAAAAQHLYQVYPAGEGVDLLVWTARPIGYTEHTAEFFEGYLRAVNPQRAWLRPVRSLWGYTGRSDYSKGRSNQEVDPFGGSRRRYLVVYPFVKTKDWYLLGRDARQGMMIEHIRLGKQYTAIHQLLLYSFGLQDQEFVVVYEMDDLPQFSDLVHELRGTEARRYTERDAPLQTAIYHPLDNLLRLWSEF
jgi:chlorite dismutase